MDRFHEPTLAQERQLVPSAKAREAWHALQRIADAERRAMIAISAALVTLRHEAADAYHEVLCDAGITAEQLALTRNCIADDVSDLLYDMRAQLRAVDNGEV